jgi:DNA-binding MarR family transcriptional regulator
VLKKLIIDSVRVLNNTAQAYIRQEFAKGGLTEPQVNAMIEIVAQDGPTITELSRRLHLNHSTVSGIVDRWRRAGTS